MNHLGIVVGMMAILLLIFVIRKFSVERRMERDRIKKGLIIIKHIEKIVAVTQQHRGISNAIQQGNTSLKPQLIAIEEKLDHLITEGSNLDLSIFSQWKSFAENWPILKKHSLDCDLKPQELMRQHNEMIEEQLSLFDVITRYYNLHTIMLDDINHASELCLDMLRVVEAIAQARGVGAGICAKGKCEGVDKINLNALKIFVTSSTKELFNELKDVRNPKLSEQFSVSSRNIKDTADRLVDVIEHQVLIDGNIEINSKDYFTLATKPIDELLKAFNNTVAFVSRHEVNIH